MCYYATTDYLCGDWKWGNMMLRCPRQHRIGETCGAKLVHHESVTKSATICKICEEINTKQRRLSKTYDNISRWSREPDKFSASLDKARREALELDDKIKDLHLRRPSIATNLQGGSQSTGSSRHGSTAPAAATVLPPVASLSSSASAGYEYTSMAGVGRRQDSGTFNIPRNGVIAGTGGVNLAPGQPMNQYASMPAANYASRGMTAMAPAAVHVDRQGTAYAVPYGRR